MSYNKAPWIVAFVTAAMSVLLGISHLALGGAPSTGQPVKDSSKRYERSYVLATPQIELLALLLRLNLPRETTVTTGSRGEMAITGPKRVHDAVGSLVDLLNEEQAAKEKKQMADRGKDMFETLRRESNRKDKAVRHGEN